MDRSDACPMAVFNSKIKELCMLKFVRYVHDHVLLLYLEIVRTVAFKFVNIVHLINSRCENSSARDSFATCTFSKETIAELNRMIISQWHF